MVINIQALLDANAGGLVTLPNGTYTLPHSGAGYCLRIPAGTTLRGESRDGCILRAAAGLPDAVQLLQVSAPDARIERLMLDGNASEQTVSIKQQRHGVFCKQGPRCSIVDVTARNFTGDGFYFYDGSDDPLVSGCLSTDNQRNGLTMGGRTTGGMFRNSQFVGNGAEQFDLEGGLPISGGTITGCTFDTLGRSNDFVLTITGHAWDIRSSGWTITHNTVNGAVAIVWATDVVFAHNTGTNATGKPSVYIYRTCDRILIHRNDLHTIGSAQMDGGSMVHIVGTNPLQSPGGVVVSDNVLTTTQPVYGVSAVCARDVQITGNTITGVPGQRYECGVYVRTTRELEPVRLAIIERNAITGFSGHGVRLDGNGAARIDRVRISDNVFSCGKAALNLNSGLNEARDVTVYGNTADGVEMIHPPAGVPVPWGDGTRWVMT